VHEYLVALLSASQQPPVRYSGISREDYKRLQAMADKLSGNPAKKFPLHDLSMQLHMNEKKLNRIFGQIFGKPVFEYHLEARMKEAHRLLEETDLTTKQVAARVGYARTTSFISRFKDFFGYPPGEITRSK
jgi:AraC-like DNA-binding protein